MRDAAIQCMQWARTDNYDSLTGSQWIATGFALATTRVVENGGEQTFKKLRFFFFWGTTAFPVSHKENLGIALTFMEGKNRIDTGDHIPTQ